LVDEESGRSDALELGRRVGNLKGEEDAFAVEGFGTRWPRRMVRGHEGDMDDSFRLNSVSSGATIPS